MRKPSEVIINGKTLDEILERHQHWFCRDCVGWENMCANLSYADLHEVDFRAKSDNALFSYGPRHPCTINIYNTDLSYANLGDVNLSGVDMQGANLCGADLRYAHLYKTVLIGANLYLADLCEANLYDSNLAGAIYGILP